MLTKFQPSPIFRIQENPSRKIYIRKNTARKIYIRGNTTRQYTTRKNLDRQNTTRLLTYTSYIYFKMTFFIQISHPRLSAISYVAVFCTLWQYDSLGAGFSSWASFLRTSRNQTPPARGRHTASSASNRCWFKISICTTLEEVELYHSI